MASDAHYRSEYLVNHAVTTQSRASEKLRLVKCPACHADLQTGLHSVSEHIARHDPEDFGLSPLGEIA